MTEEMTKIGVWPDGATPANFSEPWMARAFGLVTALSQAGVISLTEFQKALIQSLAAREQWGEIVTEIDYYTCWVNALSELLQERQLVAFKQILEAERGASAEAKERREHQHALALREDGKLHVRPIAVA
ncbi:MAG TPA: nitrile hydratase accessory protein [Rhodopila sp.]|jgi:nitrile hydratase accessory protein|nr:nitrile hydratase accessory protein [Rhodopila sp.]